MIIRENCRKARVYLEPGDDIAFRDLGRPDNEDLTASLEVYVRIEDVVYSARLQSYDARTMKSNLGTAGIKVSEVVDQDDGDLYSLKWEKYKA